MRKREHEADHAGRHRTAYAVRCNGQQNAAPGARRHIDRIVADAEAGDELDLAVRARQGLARDFRRHQADRVVGIAIFRRQFRHLVRQEFPFDRRIIEHPECFFTEYRAVRGNRVAGNADSELGCCHFVFLSAENLADCATSVRDCVTIVTRVPSVRQSR